MLRRIAIKSIPEVENKINDIGVSSIQIGDFSIDFWEENDVFIADVYIVGQSQRRHHTAELKRELLSEIVVFAVAKTYNLRVDSLYELDLAIEKEEKNLIAYNEMCEQLDYYY